MKIQRSGTISAEFTESLKKAGLGQDPNQPEVAGGFSPEVAGGFAPDVTPQAGDEIAPQEAGVPFTRPESGLDEWNGELELPFDDREWGLLVPSSSNWPYDVTIYYDPRYEPAEAGGMEHPEISGGYDPVIHNIVVNKRNKRDVLSTLPPQFVENLEEKLGESLNNDSNFDPGDSDSGPDYGREWAGQGPMR